MCDIVHHSIGKPQPAQMGDDAVARRTVSCMICLLQHPAQRGVAPGSVATAILQRISPHLLTRQAVSL
jgi:hypothetical protein